MLQHIKEIAAIAFETLQKREVIFKTGTSIHHEDLEKMGFLVRVDNPEENVIWYEFRHLVLQEILSAIHMFLLGGSSKETYFGNKNLEACIPLLVGLEGLLSQFFDGFINKRLIINSYLRSWCVYEYRGLTEETVQKILASRENRDFQFFTIQSGYNLHHEIHFIEKLIENSIDINLSVLTLDSGTSKFIKPDSFKTIIKHHDNKEVNTVTIAASEISIDLLSQYIEILRDSTVSVRHVSFRNGGIEITKNSVDKIAENLSHVFNRVKSILIHPPENTTLPDVSETLVLPAVLSNNFKSSNSLAIYGKFPDFLIESFYKFKGISITNSEISFKGLNQLSNIIKEKQTIKKLTLRNCNTEERELFNDTISNTVSSFKYLQSSVISDCNLTTTTLYKILQMMFSDNSQLQLVDLSHNNFSVRVSEEEEEIMRNHLKAFDYISCTRAFVIELYTNRMICEVFQPLLGMLKFNVSIALEEEAISMDISYLEEEMRKKVSNWKKNNTKVLSREIKFNNVKYTNLFDIYSPGI